MKENKNKEVCQRGRWNNQRSGKVYAHNYVLFQPSELAELSLHFDSELPSSQSKKGNTAP